MRIDECKLPLHEMLDSCVRLYPEKTFIYSYDTTYNYEETLRLSNGLANSFLSMGIGRSDKCCLVLPRTPELVLAFLAMSRIGAVPVPVNYTLSKGDVEAFIASVAPALIVVHEKMLNTFDATMFSANGVRVMVVGKEAYGYLPWCEACDPVVDVPKSEVAFDDIAYLNYTTGSSGAPKGAIATHSNLYWNTLASVEAMEITGKDVHLCMFASFAHPHELFLRALYTGGAIVLLEEINPKTISRTILEKSVTCMMGLSPMYDMMSTHCSHLDFPSLRVAESGGMFSRPEIIKSFKDKFGIPILSVWGSTETSGIALANTPSEHREDGSTGRVCPHYEIRLVNDNGKDVRPGGTGEMAFRGKGIVSGYVNTTEYSYEDGWYMSGDIARMDEEGYCYFIERKSGMLKVAGLKVYPLQVELLLMSSGFIKEAAVIGVEERLRGVVPKAFVIPLDGHRIDPDDVKKFCKGRIADYMIPKHVEIVDDLPRIGSGKVNKKALQGSKG